jgi:predicted esterase
MLQRKGQIFVLPLLMAMTAVQARELPVQPRRVGEGTAWGRTLYGYEHANLETWGYATAQSNNFWLVLPGKATSAAPLCVVLHSAGGNGTEPFAPICAPHVQRGFYGDETFYVLSLDCARNRNDWWWGAEEISRNAERYKEELCPTEKRVLATVEWVVSQFGIDRNRIYLNGISMGGSGTLGMALNHGDIFAAAAVIVPAGISHARSRFLGREVKDPPPLLDILSHCDGYSDGHEALMAYVREHHYAAAFAWVPWGHAAAQIGTENPLSCYRYPWLAIRRNEAYPVFTAAASDNRYPGFNNKTAPDQTGQINLYFRWKNRTDERQRFAAELWVAHPDELGMGATAPESATADVTLRRLQKFAPAPGREYRWRLMEGDTLRQEGKVTADKGLLTIPDVRLMRAPGLLTVE